MKKQRKHLSEAISKINKQGAGVARPVTKGNRTMEQQQQVMDNTKEVEAVEALIAQLTVKAKRPRANAMKTHFVRQRALETLEEMKQDFVNAQFEPNFEWSDTTRQRLVKAFKFLRKKENGGWWCHLNADWCDDKHAEVMRSSQNQVWLDHQEKDRLKDWNMGFFQFTGSSKFLFNTFESFGLDVEWNGEEDGGLKLLLPSNEDW